MSFLDNIKGLVYYFFKSRKFDFQKYFKGKRVVVIGAADSVFEKEMGHVIDGFEVVIRFNKSLITYNSNFEKFLGKKSDVLIHNFHENFDDGGGGPLDWNVFDQFSLKHLVQAKSNFPGKRDVFNYYKKYKTASREVFVLPSKWYKSAQKPFGTYSPTRGFLGIFLALNSEAKEVFLTGFTFFKTAYAVGYRDNIQSVEKTLEHIDRQGFHDAEMEFQNFLHILKMSKVKNIWFDEALYKIIQNEEERTSKSILNSNMKKIENYY